jgi:hypothetical protein
VIILGYMQVNLEYIGRVVFNTNGLLYPDSVLGTDCHTTMINGLRIVGLLYPGSVLRKLRRLLDLPDKILVRLTIYIFILSPCLSQFRGVSAPHCPVLQLSFGSRNWNLPYSGFSQEFNLFLASKDPTCGFDFASVNLKFSKPDHRKLK